MILLWITGSIPTTLDTRQIVERIDTMIREFDDTT
jgi:hypothetical protein